MNRPSWKYLTIIAVIILGLSSYGCYSFFQKPVTNHRRILDLMYSQNAHYSYRAYVEPSLLYDNRTEVTENTLYSKLVEKLVVTLNYSFIQDPRNTEFEDIDVCYDVSATLTGGYWSKKFLLEKGDDKPRNFIQTYTIELEEIKRIIDTIGEETGIRVHSYTYEIQPNITFQASTGEETITQEFNPILSIKFQGGKIEFENLENTKTGSITHPETEEAKVGFLLWNPSVRTMRKLSILSIAVFGALTSVSTYFTLQERRERPFLERLEGEIRDKIIEGTEPTMDIERATIKVDSIDALARVSEETFKPIIHHDNLFYVLDGDLKYEFRMAALADEGC